MYPPLVCFHFTADNCSPSYPSATSVSRAKQVERVILIQKTFPLFPLLLLSLNSAFQSIGFSRSHPTHISHIPDPYSESLGSV